ncbi:MAG: cupin domain-containing protein [Acetobacteraceae bacterium]|nr:cupin domain-containing protein [Acetobacteraceae bacterium]
MRELHWHTASEWAYTIEGRARITAVDQNGRAFVDDIGKGDLWFFPPAIPHSIQGLEPDGRVPPCLRRRQFQRGQHLPPHGLAASHSPRG